MNKPKQITLRTRSGFTLVELMVTITIVVILAGLSFWGATKARARADFAVAMNRLKAFPLANAGYASDHNGKYVPVYTFDENRKASVQWHYNLEFLEPLIGDAEKFEEVEEHEGTDGLPEDVLDPVVVRAKKKFWSRISASYGYNHENMPGGGFGGKNTARGHTIASVRLPSKTCAFITGTDWIAKYGGRYIWQDESKAIEGKTPDGKIAYRHGGKAIAAFYDGHIETLTMEDMRKIDQRGGINNAFWGGDRP